jgi:hypothetical protein
MMAEFALPPPLEDRSMTKKVLFAAALVAALANMPAALAEGGAAGSATADAESPPIPVRPHKAPRRSGMAMKPVVCRAIDEAKGKSGAELAQAIEEKLVEFHRANYRLASLLAGDPPVACFYSITDPGKLPMGAR